MGAEAWVRTLDSLPTECPRCKLPLEPGFVAAAHGIQWVTKRGIANAFGQEWLFPRSWVSMSYPVAVRCRECGFVAMDVLHPTQ